MADTIIVALIAFAGTVAGTFGGIVTANKLANYRIEQLEKKVDKHNQIVERTYILEEELKMADFRITDLEKAVERR